MAESKIKCSPQKISCKCEKYMIIYCTNRWLDYVWIAHLGQVYKVLVKLNKLNVFIVKRAKYRAVSVLELYIDKLIMQNVDKLQTI